MNRAELAAEVLRIHDMIAAEPGPRHDIDWHDVRAAVAGLDTKVVAATEHWRATNPQPRMVDGLAECRDHCSFYSDRQHLGYCNRSGTRTADGVPCRPWVDATLQHQRDVNEAQANAWQREVDGLRQELAAERAKNEAMQNRMDSAASRVPPLAQPCLFWDRHPSHLCNEMTVCRNTSGYPLCRAHGGRQPGEKE